MCNYRIFSASSYFAQITPTDFTAWGFVHNGVKKKIKIKYYHTAGRGTESDGGCLARRTPGAGAEMCRTEQLKAATRLSGWEKGGGRD